MAELPVRLKGSVPATAVPLSDKLVDLHPPEPSDAWITPLAPPGTQPDPPPPPPTAGGVTVCPKAQHAARRVAVSKLKERIYITFRTDGDDEAMVSVRLIGNISRRGFPTPEILPRNQNIRQ